MTIDLQICNEALAEIGARSTIADPAEVSTEANAARLFFDVMRQRLLRAVHWGFARQTLLLTQSGTLQNGTSPYPYLYQYDLPDDSLTIRYILPTNAGDLTAPLSPRRDCRFLVTLNADADAKVIVSNVPYAVAVYTADVDDVTLFDPLFHAAYVAALAAKFVMPCTGNVALKSTYQQIAELTLQTAQAADANEAVPSTDSIPDWLLARACGYAYSGNSWGNWYQYPSPMSWGG